MFGLFPENVLSDWHQVCKCIFQLELMMSQVGHEYLVVLGKLTAEHLERVDRTPRIKVSIESKNFQNLIFNFDTFGFANLSQSLYESSMVCLSYFYGYRQLSQRTQRLCVEIVADKDNWPFKVKCFALFFLRRRRASFLSIFSGFRSWSFRSALLQKLTDLVETKATADCSINFVNDEADWLLLKAKVWVCGDGLFNQIDKVICRPNVTCIYFFCIIPALLSYDSCECWLPCSRWTMQRQKLLILPAKFLVCGCPVCFTLCINLEETHLFLELNIMLWGNKRVWHFQINFRPLREDEFVPAFHPSHNVPIGDFFSEQIKKPMACILLNPELIICPHQFFFIT